MGDTAGTGAWLVLLLAAVFFSFEIFIIVYLSYVYKGKTLFEYSKILAGKVATYCFAALYAVYFTIMLAFIIRSSADIIKAEILYKTPIWATMLLITSISLYAASKGLTNIGRLIEFLGLIILPIGFVLNTITFHQGNILNIMPLFDASQKDVYIHALPSAIFGFLGFEVITIIPFSASNGAKAIWTSILSIFVLCFFYILIVESCYVVLGVDDIVNYDYPLITAIRRLDINVLQFAKRLDLFFIIIWLSSIFCSLSMLIFTAAEYTRRFVRKINLNILLVCICALACFMGLLVPNSEEVGSSFLWFATYVGLIPAFVPPFVLFILHLFRGPAARRKSEDREQIPGGSGD